MYLTFRERRLEVIIKTKIKFKIIKTGFKISLKKIFLLLYLK